MNVNRARELFIEIVANVPPEEWDRRLAELAGADVELRRKVQQLLAAHRQADSFLESPPSLVKPPASPPDKESRERVNPFIHRFEEAWQSGSAPSIDEFLPREGPGRLAVLNELVKVDMEMRQKAGLTVRPEDYLERYPELAPYLHSTRVHAAPTPSPPPASEQVGMLVAGRYKLLEPIGEGGMGTVWVAEQTQPVRRKVALKLIKAGMDSKTVLARFEAERQALALMDHPNIAKVLDGGTVGQPFQADDVARQAGKPDLHFGRPFFVMEFVKGIPFTKYCDEARLSVQERLALFMPVCHAVQHAHQKGIIHRDLKPSNILVCLYDGVPVPKVIDFGLAKAMYQPLTEQTLHTAQGMMMGTPLYMSPEQAEVNNLDVDTRSDIYSLGVILYELLTGTTPLERKRFKEAAWHEMLRLIKEEEPPKPSMRLSGSGTLPTVAAQRKLEPAKLAKLVRGDLDWIVMKALDKERGRRYETANGLARDIQNYLADEPVEATPPSASYRLRKFARKHKKALTTAAAFVVLLVAGLVASTLLAVWATSAENEANRQRIASDKAKQEAVEARDEVEANLYVARMNLAQTDWENANVGRIVKVLEPYRQLPAGKRDPRGWEWYYQDRLCQLELRTLKGHTDVIWSVAFSPDGSRLASASADGTVKVWNAASGQELHKLKGHTAPVTSVAFSPDGSRLASASEDQTIRVWDAASGEELLRPLKGHTDGVRSVAFSPDGSQLASASRDLTIKVWDTASGKELCTLKGHTGQVWSVAFSPDGSRLASASQDLMVKVWDAASGEELLKLKGHTASVGSVAFSPDGNRLASGSGDQTIRVWDAASGQELLKLKGHTGEVGSVAFSPDGSRLASASGDQTIKIWDTASGQELLKLKGHTNFVPSVAFSPDGSRLASASWDQTIKVWDTAGGQELRTLKGHTGAVTSVAFSPDGSRLASASGDQTIKVWDTASGQVLRTLKGHTGQVWSVAFSPDGSRLASASEDHTIKVWDAASGQKLLELTGHKSRVWSVAFSPDGSRLASGGGDGTIKVWDAASGQKLLEFEKDTGQVYCVAFGPDGSRLASASWGQTIRIWDAASGQKLRTLKGHTGPGQALSVAFSPDGSRLASASWDHTVRVWDAASGQELLKLEGHTIGLWSVAFSPDGSRLASASADGTVRVWDAASGQELRTLKGHTGGVRSVAFSPDSKLLASASPDQTIHVRDARPWTPELRRRREALGLVEYLCQKSSSQDRKLPSKEQVSEDIRVDKGITEQVRDEALTLLEVYWPRWCREGGPYLARAETGRGQGRLAEAEADIRKAVELGAEPALIQRASRLLALATRQGLIQQWLVVGPLPLEGRFGPESLGRQQLPGEADLRPREGEPSARGLVWRKLDLGDDFKIDFRRLFEGKPTENSVAYAVSYLFVDEQLDGLKMLVGSDDQAKIYLNGNAIHEHDVVRVVTPDEDTIPNVTLEAGHPNVLVFKVVNGAGPWGGCIRVVDRTGLPAKGIRVSLTPNL